MAAPAPLVSVFTAAHGTGRLIEVPWRSLVAQVHANWEWVIVDDSGDDHTADVIAELARSPLSGGRVRLHRRRGDGSIGATKAAACAACRGQLLVELDHDDELLPDALSAVAAAFNAHSDIDFVYSDWIDYVTGDQPRVAALYGPEWGLGFGGYATELVRGRRVVAALSPRITWETVRHIVSMPNHLRAWRATAYRRIGGHDPAVAVGDDYELLVRTFLAGRMARIPRPLYVQSHDPVGRSASRRFNAAIQGRVAAVVRERGRELDERCLSLGAIPHQPSPLTSAARLHACEVRCDPASAGPSPLVSVVAEACGSPDRLRRALERALDQSYGNLEVLAVGEASAFLRDIVREFDEARVRHWNLDWGRHAAGFAARNYAIKAMARGSVIAYASGRWESSHVERSVEHLAADGCRGWVVTEDGVVHQRDLLDRHGYWGPVESELLAAWERDEERSR